MIRAATASLAFLILLSGCAMSPRFTEYPQDCNRGYWDGEMNADVWSHAKALGRTFEKALPYLCVENPETVQLPSAKIAANVAFPWSGDAGLATTMHDDIGRQATGESNNDDDPIKGQIRCLSCGR